MIKGKRNDAEQTEKKDEILSDDIGGKGDSKISDENDEQINKNGSEEAIDYDAEIERKNKEIQSLTETMKRRQADFENYKKRMIKSQEDFKKFAIKDFALDVIQINDDLLRALKAASSISEGHTIEETSKAFSEGFLMISKRIEEVLEKYGIEEIDSLGKEFDPNLNEAVEIEQSRDVDKDTVTKIHQKGFKLDDYIIRCAKVKVAKPVKLENEINRNDQRGIDIEETCRENGEQN